MHSNTLGKHAETRAAAAWNSAQSEKQQFSESPEKERAGERAFLNTLSEREPENNDHVSSNSLYSSQFCARFAQLPWYVLQKAPLLKHTPPWDSDILTQRAESSPPHGEDHQVPALGLKHLFHLPDTKTWNVMENGVPGWLCRRGERLSIFRLWVWAPHWV